MEFDSRDLEALKWCSKHKAKIFFPDPNHVDVIIDDDVMMGTTLHEAVNQWRTVLKSEAAKKAWKTRRQGK